MVYHKIVQLRRFVSTRLGIEVDDQKSARLRKVRDIRISRTGVDLNQVKVGRTGTCLAVTLHCQVPLPEAQWEDQVSKHSWKAELPTSEAASATAALSHELWPRKRRGVRVSMMSTAW